MKRSLLARSSLLAVLLAGCARDEAPSSARVPPDELVLRFHADAVDGTDEIVVRDGVATIEHLAWRPMLGERVELAKPLPDLVGRRFAVRARVGRPAVSIAERPSAPNGDGLRVRIDDGPYSGAAPLDFELWAVASKPTPRPYDVVIVTIDSLRPDHLGCYGHARPTSPGLDALAARSVRYANAFSTSSFTPPSHASLLTSRQVGDHGLLTWNAMSDAQVTLAEVLAAHGYRTGASVNLTLLSENNLGQGVEWQREGEREAPAIVADALQFVRSSAGSPYFLWIHLYDVHRPYGRAEGWTERFGKAPREGIGDGEDDYNLKPEQVKKRALTRADLAYLVDRYDAGIAYADHALSALWTELSTPERAARTLVVVTADHGESLLEHDERLFSHDPFLYSSVGRIPLIVRYPDGLGAGTTRTDPVSLIDVAPTVLATLGIASPPTFAGRSLRALEEGESWPARELYQECWGWERLACIRTREWLAIRDSRAGGTRVFALASDPEERAPLDPASTPGAAALVRALDAFATRRPDDGAPRLDPDLQRRLNDLGYGGGDEPR